MKVLWLCNMTPGAVRKAVGAGNASGLWIDHVLKDIRGQGDIRLQILFPGDKSIRGMLDPMTGFQAFSEGLEHIYPVELEKVFTAQLLEFNPDIVHIWGTEYGHTLAMLRAAKNTGTLPRTVVSIQGLCSIYTAHYCEGLPARVRYGFTFRDLLRMDNPRLQQRKFRLRGEMERKALEMAPNVIGRTYWDRACTRQANPERRYYFCNETLREAFYSDSWQYDACRKHSIFASSCDYPIKGFHYLLEAFRIVRKKYPDACICVPGESFLDNSIRTRLRRQSYAAYMRRFCLENDMAESIEFLGRLSEIGMKQAFLRANVFVMPSTIENSCNSLGEAMLLGVPCVAADVGGTTDLLRPGEGRIYPSSAPYLLAEHIIDVFEMEENAGGMGRAAAEHARQTHNAGKNLDTLLEIYRSISSEE